MFGPTPLEIRQAEEKKADLEAAQRKAEHQAVYEQKLFDAQQQALQQAAQQKHFDDQKAAEQRAH